MKYIIKFKENDQQWRSTSYTSPDPVSEEFLISFFGLDECEDYLIEAENN